jgi:hypothetical protein
MFFSFSQDSFFLHGLACGDFYIVSRPVTTKTTKFYLSIYLLLNEREEAMPRNLGRNKATTSGGEGGLQGKWRDQTPRPEVVITGGLFSADLYSKRHH